MADDAADSSGATGAEPRTARSRVAKLLLPFPPRRRRRRDLYATRGSGRDVLVTTATFLAVAALLNGPSLYDAAQRQQPGVLREVALGVSEPLSSLSSAVAADVPRRAISDTMANWAYRPGQTASVRTGGQGEPVRAVLVGDSMMRNLSPALVRELGTDTPVHAETLAQPGTGLAGTELFDWPGAMSDLVDTHDPDVVVVLLGPGATAWGPVGDDGQRLAPGSDEWVAWYAGLAGDAMDRLSARGASVVWVTAPAVSPGHIERFRAPAARAVGAAARERRMVTVVDAGEALSPAGEFQSRILGPDGRRHQVRDADGVHFTAYGARLLADHVAGRIDLSARA